MRAVKANKEYAVTEENKELYRNQGFDIFDDDGKLLECGKGKKVAYETYRELQRENEALKKTLQSRAEELPADAPKTGKGQK